LIKEFGNFRRFFSRISTELVCLKFTKTLCCLFSDAIRNHPKLCGEQRFHIWPLWST